MYNMEEKLTLYSIFENSLCTSSCIIYWDGREKHSITFDELRIQVYYISTELDNLLLSKSIICCLLKPSLAIPAVILGILKVVSTFAFLDIYKPWESLQAYQKHLEIKALLIEVCFLKDLESKLCHCWKKTKELHTFSNFIILRSSKCENVDCTNSKIYKMCYWQPKIAYAIQTSGTTGEPKVVQVPHDCIISNILDFRCRFSVTANDVILQSTRITFDPSIIEIFLSLSCGATLVIIAENIRSSPERLTEILVSSNVTILQGTPSLILNFGEKTLKEILLRKDSVLRILAFGGELCPSVNKLRRWKCEGNKTEIYNLFGLTEVSCWASCFKIDFTGRDSLLNPPIGEPLLNTEFEIRKENGNIADKGELYIGGHKRFCIVNDEEWPKNPNSFIRPTGDLVSKAADGFIYFEGRNDNIIKYMGHKISLQSINVIVNKFPEVVHHVLHYEFSSSKIHLFVVWSPNNCCKSEIEWKLLKYLKSIPNLPAVIIHSVPFIPVTKHGKGDVEKLMSFVTSSEEKRFSADKSCFDFISILWKDYTNQLNIKENDMFILKGGNSISAVQLASEIEWHFQSSLPLLIEKILNESFKDICNYVNLCLKNRDQSISFFEHHSNIIESKNQPLPKKKCYDKSQCFKFCFKQGCYEYCIHTKENSFTENCFYRKSECSKSVELDLSLIFTWDLKKCIDATPCILHIPLSDELLIFIGSHFGMFSCIDINKRSEKWQVSVPDRIESSACISACGNYVLFGCYDHNLYCIKIDDGNIYWKYRTGAEVKSSPIVSLNNTVFVGSHDKHVYAIDVKNGFVIWKKQVSDGSIFSSPAVLEKLFAVCVGTLDGIIALLKMETGHILWKHQSKKPLFSSPLVTSNFILIGSTDKCILCLDFDGKIKFHYSTEGPVFSSCAYSEFKENKIFFGCHDSYLYCITLNGSLIWKTICDSVVYATPFPFKWNNCHYVCVASSKGTIYILQLSDGKIVLSWKCPGEIFSSPVILNDILVIGCRDNNVHCFNLMCPTDNVK